MTTMIGMPLMVDNTNCLSIFHLMFHLNTTAPVCMYTYMRVGMYMAHAKPLCIGPLHQRV